MPDSISYMIDIEPLSNHSNLRPICNNFSRIESGKGSSSHLNRSSRSKYHHSSQLHVTSSKLGCNACNLLFPKQQAMCEHLRKAHSTGASHSHGHQHAKCNPCGAEFETEAKSDARRNRSSHVEAVDRIKSGVHTLRLDERARAIMDSTSFDFASA